MAATGSLDPLIGREGDLARVTAAMATNRLVVLTGPGGSGKTRLAREALLASERETTFIDASSLTDTGLLPSTILAGVAVGPEPGTDPIASIAVHVDGRGMAVAVDNLEQLRGAGHVIAQILGAAPTLSILATSRVPLGIPGEIEISVPPLTLPEGDDPETVERSPAGALFLVRARSIGRLHQLGDRDAADVAGLCRRLDGLPLAIELAAGRTRILSPGEILARIGRLGLGAIDPGMGQPRSMRAVLDWTIGFLEPQQRAVLDAAAICEGFDLDLLEALIDDADAAVALEDLVALGLVSHIGLQGDRTRFRLMETIRQHVRGVMPRDRSEQLVARLAHAVAERADAMWDGADHGEPESVRSMEADLDNDRRAMSYAVAMDPDLGLRLWRRLHPVWANGRLVEAIDWFERLRDATGHPTVDLVRGMSEWGRYVSLVRGVAAGTVARHEAARLATAVDDPTARAAALSGLAEEALVSGNPLEAERLLAELSELLDSDNVDARLHAGEALGIAYIAIDGPLGERAIELFERLAETAIAVGRNHMAMSWLGNAAFLHLCRGEHEAAIRSGRASVEMAPGIDQNYMLIGLAYLAIALAASGRVTESSESLLAALGTEPAQGDGPFAADLLRAAAAMEAYRGGPLAAARFMGAAERAAERKGDVLDAGDQLLAERTLAEIRRRARELDVELAIRDGAAADTTQVLDALRRELVAEAAQSGRSHRGAGTEAPGRPPALRHGELTKREVEILGLVGQGRSDPEIADLLFISPKTVSVHVANIKAKLDAHSRLEVALRARDLGLA